MRRTVSVVEVKNSCTAVGQFKRRSTLGNFSVNERIISEWILKTQGLKLPI
jgi:hypothetical protein